MNPANLLQCATFVLGHPGPEGGGAFGNFTYHGSQIYHISHGEMGGNQGCTLFFADSGGGIGVIVAIGYQRDNAGLHGVPRYQLVWVKDNWHIGNTISP